MIAVALGNKTDQHTVNRISSIYGKDRIFNYIHNQIKFSNLIAINKTKADTMLRPRGLQLPNGETYISYDDTIAYTLNNVKFPKPQLRQEASVFAAYKEAATAVDTPHTYSSHGTPSPISQFIDDLYTNDFIPSQRFLDNYRRLLLHSANRNIALSDIARLYVSGAGNTLINEIGDELKRQELERQSEITLKEEP